MEKLKIVIYFNVASRIPPGQKMLEMEMEMEMELEMEMEMEAWRWRGS